MCVYFNFGKLFLWVGVFWLFCMCKEIKGVVKKRY